MNFTEKVKAEITENGVNGLDEATACLSAYVHLRGALCRSRYGMGFEFSCDNEEVINYIVDLFNTYYGTNISELDVDEDRLNNSDKFTGSCTFRNATDILADLGCISKDNDSFTLINGVPDFLLVNDDMKKAYLKGAILGGGNMTLPNDDGSKTGYHFEIVTAHRETALGLSELTAYFDIITKIVKRKEMYAVYLKNSEDIKDLLALLGLNKCVLEITDLMCLKEFSSNVNRQRNCDLGNLNKQVDAVERQINAFSVIRDTIGTDGLDKTLVDVMEAREKYREDTLSELAERLNITKSCLNHRLRKIMTIADNLK